MFVPIMVLDWFVLHDMFGDFVFICFRVRCRVTSFIMRLSDGASLQGIKHHGARPFSNTIVDKKKVLHTVVASVAALGFGRVHLKLFIFLGYALAWFSFLRHRDDTGST